MKFIFLFVLVFSCLTSFSQNVIKEANISATGLAGTGSSLPFWFSQNQLGKYSKNSNFQELTEGEISGEISLSKKTKLLYGTDIAFLTTENNFDAKIIQAYAGISGNILTLKGGTFADKEISGGLSSTNGDIVRSLNSRPYPMMRLSTSGYIPFIFAHKWFRFKAEFDEGLLHDTRVVYHPHLQHKSLDLLFLTENSWQLTAGFNEYVFWGGTLSDGTELPHSFSDYLRYLSGSSGSSDFLITDQMNVAGDQLGSYRVTAKKDYDSFSLQFRISHPFEDHSGMELKNWRDNLISLYIVKKRNHTLLDEFLAEFLYSKNQSGKTEPKGGDNYFNNGVYKTDFSYKGFCMGDPLFYPLRKNTEGVYSGIENNRISAFHFGAKGFISERINYKTLFTFSNNFGTHSQPYNPVKKQFSSLIKLSGKCSSLPLDISVSFAADFGDLLSNSAGLGIGCRWSF